MIYNVGRCIFLIHNKNIVYETGNHGTIDFPIMVYEHAFAEGFTLYPHYHKELELFLLLEGDALFYIDGREYNIHPGDIVFLNQYQIHSGTYIRQKKARFIAIVFSPHLIQHSHEDLISVKYINSILEGRYLLPQLINPDKPCANQLRQSMEQIHQYFQMHTEGYELLTRIEILKIWSILYSLRLDEQKAPAKRELNQIRQVLEYIDTHYSSKITLTDLAKLCNFSKEHFGRVFQNILQVTPFEYLINIRLQHSTDLLLTTSKSILEIALSCGFSDSSYYSKMFRRRYGCSPLQYKKRMLNL